jgi:uncharacterized membrane protein YgdD (TMEM256/DUF423 family)
MAISRDVWIRLAALSGLVSVAAGAFAAHGLTAESAKMLVRTGSSWQAVHSLAALAAVALAGPDRPVSAWPPGLFLAGATVFAGSLYALALGAPHLAGAITPVGGLMFLAGWIALALTGGAAQRKPAA